ATMAFPSPRYACHIFSSRTDADWIRSRDCARASCIAMGWSHLSIGVRLREANERAAQIEAMREALPGRLHRSCRKQHRDRAETPSYARLQQSQDGADRWSQTQIVPLLWSWVSGSHN